MIGVSHQAAGGTIRADSSPASGAALRLLPLTDTQAERQCKGCTRCDGSASTRRLMEHLVAWVDNGNL
jgi:hypothetical protein